jgi:hypothetical protein
MAVEQNPKTSCSTAHLVFQFQPKDQIMPDSQPVTLDMSTAQPINQPVKIDMSTAQPIPPPPSGTAVPVEPPPPPSGTAVPATLAQRVKAKYPEYSDMDDATLESKVLAKHPEYSDLPRTPTKATAKPSQPSTLDSPDQASQHRMSAVAGLTGMPTPNMNESDRKEFETGKAAGAVSNAAVASVGSLDLVPEAITALKAAAAAHPAAAAVIKWGLEKFGAGALLGAGYKVSKLLK